MSVRKVALQCAELLGQAQLSQSLNPDTRLELQDIAFMFRVWAGNVGVFAPGNASIEYRLREDSDVMEALHSMLVSLVTCIEHIINPPLLEEDEKLGEEQDEEDRAEGAPILEPSTLQFSSGSSSSSLTFDSDGTEDERMARQAPGPIRSLQKAKGLVGHLYKLASVIRKPTSANESLRVRDFITKQTSRGETEELEDIEDHARCHMQARFPKASKVLVDRLVAAVVFRRMTMRYRQRHELKLHQGVESSFQPVSISAPTIIDKAGPTAGYQGMHMPGMAVPSMGKSEKGPTRDSRSINWSATDASSIYKARFATYAKSTALSGITHSAVARRQNLDIPLPPQSFGLSMGKVKCTYCMRFINKEETQQPHWTRHVIKDIDPYVCLFEECKQGDALFHSIEEWLGHMQWQHTVLWSCQAPEHDKYIYDSEAGLEEHIKHMHPGSFTEGQLPGLVEQGAFPAPDTFAILALSYDTPSTTETASESHALCPICRNFPQASGGRTKEDEESSQEMQSHIIGHLESIALLSLPQNDVLDCEESNVKQSNDDSIAVVQDLDDDPPSLPSRELPEPSESSDLDHDGPMATAAPLLEGDEEKQWAIISAQLQLPEQSEDPLLLQWGASLHLGSQSSESAQLDDNKGYKEESMGFQETTAESRPDEPKGKGLWKLEEYLPDDALAEIIGYLPDRANQSRHTLIWMNCMLHFAAKFKKIKALNDNITDPSLAPVQIALIDDGVDVTHPDFHDIAGSKFHGRSFKTSQHGSTTGLSPYWVSESGHGTLIARLIHKICPTAIIHIIKPQTFKDEKTNKIQIDPDGVIKAIDYAIQTAPQMICISWAIKPPTGLNQERLDDAIDKAINNHGILCFCALNDQGESVDFTYPHASNKAIFKIAAAKSADSILDTDYNECVPDFFFPDNTAVKECGDDVDSEAFNMFDAHSSSSIANALAIGLAALMIECVRLGIIYTNENKQLNPRLAIRKEDLLKIRDPYQMRRALSRIGSNWKTGNKYIEVWYIFTAVAMNLQQREGSRILQLHEIATLARYFLEE